MHACLDACKHSQMVVNVCMYIYFCTYEFDYVCMYMNVCTCMYLSMYVYMHACLDVHVCTTWMHESIHGRMDGCMYVCTYTYVNVCTCTCECFLGCI